MNQARLVALILFTFLSIGGQSNAKAEITATKIENQTTETVWQHHIQAWSARDLSGILSDYSSDSVMVVNGRIYIGQNQIRTVFTRLFQIFDNGTNRIDTPVLNGRLVYITWHFAPTGKNEFFGTDTFLIENGKINIQTIASPLYEEQSEIQKPGN